MLWDVLGREKPALIARVNRWQEEVVKDTLQEGPTRRPSSKTHVPHRMNLRSRAIRPALAQVSENPHTRERKAITQMADSAAWRKGSKQQRRGGCRIYSAREKCKSGCRR